MKTDNDQQHKERELKMGWFTRIRIVHCTNPLLFLAHDTEAKDKCHRCIEKLRRTLQ